MDYIIYRNRRTIFYTTYGNPSCICRGYVGLCPPPWDVICVDGSLRDDIGTDGSRGDDIGTDESRGDDGTDGSLGDDIGNARTGDENPLLDDREDCTP